VSRAEGGTPFPVPVAVGSLAGGLTPDGRRKRKRPRRFHGMLAAPVDKAGGFEARRLLGFRRRNPGRSPLQGDAYATITSPVQLDRPTGSPPFWCTQKLPTTGAGRKKKVQAGCENLRAPIRGGIS
jgi:hypothetical protein